MRPKSGFFPGRVVLPVDIIRQRKHFGETRDEAREIPRDGDEEKRGRGRRREAWEGRNDLDWRRFGLSPNEPATAPNQPPRPGKLETVMAGRNYQVSQVKADPTMLMLGVGRKEKEEQQETVNVGVQY